MSDPLGRVSVMEAHMAPRPPRFKEIGFEKLLGQLDQK